MTVLDWVNTIFLGCICIMLWDINAYCARLWEIAKISFLASNSEELGVAIVKKISEAKEDEEEV